MGRRVVVAGWGQVAQRKEQDRDLKDPIGLMVEATARAQARSGDPTLISELDGISVVRVMSRHCPAAADQLGEALGASPSAREVSTIGGSSPLKLINEAANRIAQGELDRVLVAGGETYYRRKGDANVAPGGAALFQGLTEGQHRDDMIGSSDFERRHGVVLPIHGFPLFETALWAESGLSREEYLRLLARRWSRMSHVAAHQTEAWCQEPVEAETITTVSAASGNRFIAFPYSKLMNPRVSVDLGAAVLLAAEEVVTPPREGRKGRKGRSVYFLGGAYTQDRQRFLVERTDFVSSNALRVAAERTFERSGLGLDEIQAFDLYSCFPCAPTIARRMIGLSEDDPRPDTVTGGLGFFGGPGNNFAMHSFVTMAEAIASERFENGMVTGLGWFLHKHSVSLIGSDSSLREEQIAGIERQGIEDSKDELVIVGDEPVPQDEGAEGVGTIETYTVLHDRQGEPTCAILYGSLLNRADEAKGARFVALTHHDPQVYSELMDECMVGRKVSLEVEEPGHVIRAALI